MVKLWISDKLELRWNEWPKEPLISAAHIYEDQIEAYDRALAKAKAESILVDDLRIKMVVMKDAKRDSFVDYPGEMEVIQDCRFGCKHDGYNCENTPSCGLYRIARLKPVNSATESDPGVGQYYDKAHSNETLPQYINRCECELAVEKYFGLNPGYREKATIPGADYGQIVNLLAMFREDQLAASNKRIKELEQWKKQAQSVMTPILDYCTDQDNAKRLGVSLGYKIFDRVLEILKAYK